MAAVRHYRLKNPIPTPDTGTLRGDLITYLSAVSFNRRDTAVLFSMQMNDFFKSSQTTMAELRSQLLAGQPARMEQILDRAVKRGEIDPSTLTPRIVSLPGDLLRHEAMMTLRPVSKGVITAIVDEIFLPLVRCKDGRHD